VVLSAVEETACWSGYYTREFCVHCQVGICLYYVTNELERGYGGREQGVRMGKPFRVGERAG